MTDLIGPQQAILITSQASIEEFGKQSFKDDIETVFWHMPVSKEELLYAIAVHNSKNIISLIEESKVFAVNFLPFNLEKEVHQCNLIHGRHIDKFEKLNFTKKEASNIECCYIKEACAHLECHVFETLNFKDYTVFIAKIINSSIEYDVKRLFHLRKDQYTTT
ncbi:MAG: flavin reductase family protein, partial [Candidatus Woesearchaeota archaeon]